MCIRDSLVHLLATEPDAYHEVRKGWNIAFYEIGCTPLMKTLATLVRAITMNWSAT